MVLEQQVEVEVEEREKYSQRMSHQQRLDTVEVEERNGGSVVAQQSSQWSRLLFMRQKRGAAAEGKKKKRGLRASFQSFERRSLKNTNMELGRRRRELWHLFP